LARNSTASKRGVVEQLVLVAALRQHASEERSHRISTTARVRWQGTLAVTFRIDAPRSVESTNAARSDDRDTLQMR